MRLLKLTFIIACLLVCLNGFSQNFNQQPVTIAPTQKGYAETNGQKTYYEVYGEGQPLVLLHGAFMTIGLNWGPMLPELAKKHKVIAIETQGHGHSPLGSRPFSIEAVAGDVAGVLNHLNISKADVVGYSYGGTLAYQLVIKYPNLVNRVVIISSTYKSEGWDASVRNTFHMMKPEFLLHTPLDSAYKSVAPDTANFIPFVSKMLVFDTAHFDLGDNNIKAIKSPVMIICGDNDGVDKHVLFDTYKALGGGVMADMAPMPKSRLAIVPGQSHVTLMMQTDVLLKMLDGFLQ